MALDKNKETVQEKDRTISGLREKIENMQHKNSKGTFENISFQNRENKILKRRNKKLKDSEQEDSSLRMEHAKLQRLLVDHEEIVRKSRAQQREIQKANLEIETLNKQLTKLKESQEERAEETKQE